MKLVSAIMPTRGRAELAVKALKCFLAQTYPNKELIIVDDLDEPSFAEAPEYQEVRYVIQSPRRTIPEKRNFAAELAQGEIICHWDSDDWSSPERMADQVKRLEEHPVGVTGYYSMLFYEEATGRAAKYRDGHRGYAVGTSLCYRKTYWDLHRFNESLIVHEDNAFVKRAADTGELASVDGGQMMVARIHAGNTDPKNITKFASVPVSAIPQGFFECQ